MSYSRSMLLKCRCHNPHRTAGISGKPTIPHRIVPTWNRSNNAPTIAVATPPISVKSANSVPKMRASNLVRGALQEELRRKYPCDSATDASDEPTDQNFNEAEERGSNCKPECANQITETNADPKRFIPVTCPTACENGPETAANTVHTIHQS